MRNVLIGGLLAGCFALAGTFIGLYLGPSIQIKTAKTANADKIHMLYREYARLQIKQFFTDYENMLNVLNAIPHGRLQSFSVAEELNPLEQMIKEKLGSLPSKEILTVSIVLSKEYQMASRRRGLNARMQEIRSKKISNPSAKITHELQDMKSAIESYLKQQIEFNTLIYQGLASLGIDDFIYSDGATKSQKEIFEFWKRINNGEKFPDNLIPYIPWGFDEFNALNK